MTSGPCLPMVLEAEGAVARLRETIGATDPAEAAPGTVRALYAENKERNAIHASDSDDNAAKEIGFFFSDREVLEDLRGREHGESSVAEAKGPFEIQSRNPSTKTLACQGFSR